jgi:hypothetical protein
VPEPTGPLRGEKYIQNVFGEFEREENLGGLILYCISKLILANTKAPDSGLGPGLGFCELINEISI